MVLIILIMGVFSVLYGLMPTEFFVFQPDFVDITTQDKEVVNYFSAHNITVYTYTWVFDISYPDGYAYNESGLADGHRVEAFWRDDDSAIVGINLQFKHAYPSPLGAWWLLSNIMTVQEPYLTQMGTTDLGFENDGAWIEKTQLLRLSTNTNSSLFEVSDGQVTQNFVVMNPGNYSSLSDAWTAGQLHVISSYEVDFDAMKPNAFWLLAQLIFFQNPDFGLPGLLGQTVGYGIALTFWIVIALLIYTIVTRLIPTINGGIES